MKGHHEFPFGICWATVGFSAAFFLLFVQSYEVIYDLRDSKADAPAGIRTYPVEHGEQAAVRITCGLIMSSIFVLIVGYLLNYVPWRIFIMVAAPVIQLILFKRALRRRISPLDCIRMTWIGVMLLFVYHLWVAAGFPGANR
jgi:4-hydroxybenzoate polyprenyltransferase